VHEFDGWFFLLLAAAAVFGLDMLCIGDFRGSGLLFFCVVDELLDGIILGGLPAVVLFIVTMNEINFVSYYLLNAGRSVGTYNRQL